MMQQLAPFLKPLAFVVVGIALAALVADAARKRGRRFWIWFVLSVLINPLLAYAALRLLSAGKTTSREKVLDQLLLRYPLIAGANLLEDHDRIFRTYCFVHGNGLDGVRCLNDGSCPVCDSLEREEEQRRKRSRRHLILVAFWLGWVYVSYASSSLLNSFLTEALEPTGTNFMFDLFGVSQRRADAFIFWGFIFGMILFLFYGVLQDVDDFRSRIAKLESTSK